MALEYRKGRAAFAPILIALALAAPSTALASGSGGVDPHPAPATVPGAKARLVHGEAIAPASAPPAVQEVIAAANKIRTKPYIWGGGHGRWTDRGYDCSGAVSFALHGGKLLTSPLDSTSLEGWGSPGAGSWITVYANGGHAYAVIAGLRWDTAGNSRGSGPRWHRNTKAAASGPFVVRHPSEY
jgi:hypothetical protein